MPSTPSTPSTRRPPDRAEPTPLGEPVDLDVLRRRLVRLAVKLVWNRDDAEEIVQDAFHKAIQSGPSRAEARFEPWLVRTVGFLSLNHRRRKRPEALQAWMDPASQEPGEDASARAGELQRLRAAIDQLPEQQRLAIVLRTMEQLDYAAIAEIMASSVAAVRSNVHLARRQLLRILSAGQPGEAVE